MNGLIIIFMASSPIDSSQSLSLPSNERSQSKNALTRRVYKIYLESSFKSQLEDNYLSAFTLRALILAGAAPTPLNGPGLPKPFSGTRSEFLDALRKGEKGTVRKTVHETMNKMNYNGLLPFNKALDQMENGRNFLETKLTAKDEETGSTCVGMSYAILKQLKLNHNIDGMFAAERPEGEKSFTHAAVIVECSDGYVFIDPRDKPENRIFSVPFNESIKFGNFTFSASMPRSTIPLKLITSDKTYEYCTNIDNGDDLVLKHFIVEAPFEGPPASPGFPVSAWKPTGGSFKTIWVSPIHAKLTLKNMTLKRDDPERSSVISFQKIREGEKALLDRLYNQGSPTFQIPQKVIEKELFKFIDNAETINEIFFEIYIPERG